MKVYLIRNKDGEYKIGHSKHTNKRIKELLTASAHDFHLVHEYKSLNAFKIEKALHRKYSYKNINREWFDLTQEEVESFLNDCKKIDDNLIALEKMQSDDYFPFK